MSLSFQIFISACNPFICQGDAAFTILAFVLIYERIIFMVSQTLLIDGWIHVCVMFFNQWLRQKKDSGGTRITVKYREFIRNNES